MTITPASDRVSIIALTRYEKGQVIRHKARLSQRHGIDYEETYASVNYLNSTRAKLAKRYAEGFAIEQCDVDITILNKNLDEEIYVELPEDLCKVLKLDEEEKRDDVLCLLMQSLYGLKHESRIWNETIDAHLKTMDESYRCRIICVLAWIKRYQVHPVPRRGRRARCDKGHSYHRFDQGRNCVEVLGERSRTRTRYSQNLGQKNAKPCLAAPEQGVHLTKVDELQTDEADAKMKSNPYRSLVGSLMYLARGTRPDIVVTVAKLGRFLENAGMKHWDAGSNLVCSLLKTNGICTTYDGFLETELTGYLDADWTGIRDDRRSVCGMVRMICGTPVRPVANSLTEALRMTLSECIKEVVARTSYGDLQDNKGATALAKNVDYQANTNHTDIRYHFIRKKMTMNEVELVYNETKNHFADFITESHSSKT
ncbi:LOW QUALITY PROTEIN: Integrase, catalytic core protein [Phytophthora megakarya]|uniref:Integrase, catalytic core protein n=1 Tax=Phytophthora megakarya TaxID=4795 RepID=A0A225WTB4_9STRA|nr:LOW QUALITY PROTEIN: Integrase, catalytic core protein [Phytophthora megakarya]